MIRAYGTAPQPHWNSPLSYALKILNAQSCNASRRPSWIRAQIHFRTVLWDGCDSISGVSGNLLQSVADGWTAANQGPMGRVLDSEIYTATKPLKYVIGDANQQFLAGWLTGNSPASITYSPDSVEVRDMQTSLNVNRARNKFYAEGKPSVVEFGHDTIPSYLETILTDDSKKAS